MIKIIDRTNLHGSREELREAHRFRHKIFVEEAGWEPLRKPDGLERDAFDDEYAIHMLLYDQRQLVGYQRLLPTVRPYLLTEIYPQLCDGPPPASESTYELTRFAVDRVYRGDEMSISWAVAKLVLGYVELGTRKWGQFRCDRTRALAFDKASTRSFYRLFAWPCPKGRRARYHRRGSALRRADAFAPYSACG